MSRRSFYLLFLLLSLLILSGCYDEFSDGSSGYGDVGGSARVLDLPLPVGTEHLCVQGAHGGYSHQSVSTRYDLDLDTSNVEQEEVYAPAGGVAYVHDDNASSGFGYHVNIDLGDGTYVLIAHLSEIFVSNASEVAAGQLIAYEGATGYAQGDHIHLGLHRGDASQDGSAGESIPASYRVVDQSSGGGEQILGSEEFTCGIRSLGDARDGHFYASQLSVTLWHPDGTLVKTPNNARTYLLEDGHARWIENESVFWSHNYDFSDVTLVSDEELQCYGTGLDVANMYAVDAFFDTEEQLWLVLGAEGASERVRHPVRGIGWEHVLESWGLLYDRSNWPETLGDFHAYMTSWEPMRTYIGLRDGTLVREDDASDVYVISKGMALPVQNWSVYLMMGFLERDLMFVPDGTVGELHLVGDCRTDHQCLDVQAVTTCGGGLDLSEGESGGEEWFPEEDTGSSDTGTSGDTGDAGDTGNSGAVTLDCDGADACLADLDADGMAETLLMAGDQWVSSSLSNLDAYVYGNGGCFDGELTASDRVHVNAAGYYELDFSGFSRICSVQMSLISSDGWERSMHDWYWWQNAPFCSRGSQLCELMDNGTSWEEWLLAVTWDPATGLSADGNGFTSNVQL